MPRPSRRDVLRGAGATLISHVTVLGPCNRGARAQSKSAWSYRSAKDLLGALKKREISALELLEQVIIMRSLPVHREIPGRCLARGFRLP